LNDRDELHTLIDLLDGQTAKQQLHVLVDELNDEQAMTTLRRLQVLRRHLRDKCGFSL
jgi:hypothetical protein